MVVSSFKKINIMQVKYKGHPTKYRIYELTNLKEIFSQVIPVERRHQHRNIEEYGTVANEDHPISVTGFRSEISHKVEQGFTFIHCWQLGVSASQHKENSFSTLKMHS